MLIVSFFPILICGYLIIHMIYRLPENSQNKDDISTLRIGNNNVFEVGCIVETSSIGDNNVLECKSN